MRFCHIAQFNRKQYLSKFDRKEVAKMLSFSLRRYGVLIGHAEMLVRG